MRSMTEALPVLVPESGMSDRCGGPEPSNQERACCRRRQVGSGRAGVVGFPKAARSLDIGWIRAIHRAAGSKLELLCASRR